MARKTALAVFVTVLVLGIVSTTFVASAARQLQDGEGVLASIPTVAEFYTLPVEDAEDPRVSFVQKTNELTANWMTPDGKTYGRGTYRWDAVSRSFKGTSTALYMCLGEDGRSHSTVQHVVREELSVMNDRELLDRWTRPMAMDCAAGVVDIFKWVERVWVATDRDWKLLGSLPVANLRR